MMTFSPDTLDERNNKIFESLPSWKSHVLSLQKTDCDVPKVKSLKILVAIKTRDEFAQWLQEFQDLTKSTYTIRVTEPSLGKYTVFKQRLVCQHNTRSNKIHYQTVPRKTKNTNCPSNITVTIHAVHKRYKGKHKEKALHYKDMPCEIDLMLQHNHSVGSAASLPHSEVDFNAGTSMHMEFQQLNSADSREEVTDTIDNQTSDEIINETLCEIQSRLVEFAKRSPEEMGKSLKIMLENLRKIKTPSACASHLAHFAERKSRRNRGTYIGVQPTAISRRKENLVGRRSNPGGRPRLQNQMRLETEIPNIANARSHELTILLEL